MGPVAICAAVLLLVASPLMRGGNRQIALIGLEAIALVFLVSLWIRTAWTWGSWRSTPQSLLNKTAVAILVLSPAWLALVYLVPLPAGFWTGSPGRGVYGPLLAGAGIPMGASLPLSLVPDATKASLLAGIPLIAGFLAGYASRLSQLKLLVGVVAGMAFLQVFFGLLQAAGGSQSTLYFTTEFAGRPFGTFANTNHFANYIAMALAGYIWLAWCSLTESSARWTDGVGVRFAERHAQIIWSVGGLALAMGILMSFSRGAALSGLPAALLAAGLALLAGSHSRSWRMLLLLLAAGLLAAVALVGVGTLLSRFDLSKMAIDASFRGLLAKTTLAGAGEFWPWGSGWGTYGPVYLRFRPVAVDGYAEYAHEDYAQMLFEGGIFAVLVAGAFLWLAAGRVLLLVRSAIGKGLLPADQMASAFCGLGLLGFLLHSLVEFNMHIPANAILAALLAGGFLRPLRQSEAAR